MNLRELVGKKVIRTAPIMEQKEMELTFMSGKRTKDVPNYIYTNCRDTVIEVLEVIDDTPIIRVFDTTKAFNFSGKVFAVSGQLDDDNWKDVTNVMKRVTEIRDKDMARMTKDMSKLFERNAKPDVVKNVDKKHEPKVNPLPEATPFVDFLASILDDIIEDAEKDAKQKDSAKKNDTQSDNKTEKKCADKSDKEPMSFDDFINKFIM